jgi:hypothetical protein
MTVEAPGRAICAALPADLHYALIAWIETLLTPYFRVAP